MSRVCVTLAVLLSIPVFVINLQDAMGNAKKNSSGCPSDFFQCNKNDSPILIGMYKYPFILLCNLLPLITVTITSCLIITTVLLSQRRTVALVVSVSGSGQFSRWNKG